VDDLGLCEALQALRVLAQAKGVEAVVAAVSKIWWEWGGKHGSSSRTQGQHKQVKTARGKDIHM
jgi:hypothetical protein